MRYPADFPLPTDTYGESITPFANRTPMESGWVRQRKRWGQEYITMSLVFELNTVSFHTWHDWAQNNAYTWFIMPLDIVSGNRVYRSLRFITPLSYKYTNYDSVIVSVNAEVSNDADSPDPIPPNPGSPGSCVPTIMLAELESFSVPIGSTVSWTALAGGSQPIKYQWRINGVNVHGANSTYFEKLIESADDFGLYAVEVSNDCGVTSSEALVTEGVAACYECDAFFAYLDTLSIPELRAAVGGSVGTVIPAGTSFGVVEISGNDGAFKYADEGLGLLSNCEGQLALSATTSTFPPGYSPSVINNSALPTIETPGPEGLSGGIVIDTSSFAAQTAGQDDLSDRFHLKWEAEKDRPDEWAWDDANISFDISISVIRNPVGRPANTNAVLKVTANWVMSRNGTAVSTDPIVRQGTITDSAAYYFDTRVSTEPYCMPLYIQLEIDASNGASGSITGKAYAGGGYPLALGPFDTEGLIATMTIPAPVTQQEIDDTTHILAAFDTIKLSRTSRFMCPELYGEHTLYFQDWWVDNSGISNVIFDSALTEVQRNVSTLGCDPQNGCIPVTIDPLIERFGQPLEIASFPTDREFYTTITSGSTDVIYYEWSLDSVVIRPLNPTNNPVFNIQDSSDVGVYTLRVVNACGEDSESIELTLPPCTELANPSTFPSAGTYNYAYNDWPGSVTLDAYVQIGSTPISYQWYHDDVLIPGATLSYYTAPMAQQSDLGSYVCRMTNACSTLDTLPIVYTMDPPP